MVQVKRSDNGSNRVSGKSDFLIIVVIALLLVSGLIYVLLQIVGHSEEHVDKVRNTKVLYKESLTWRSDLDESERRISEDLNKSPNNTHGKYSDLNLSENCLELIGQMSKLEKLDMDRSKLRDSWLKHLANLPRLQNLSIDGNPITDKAIPYILEMKKLTSLSIGDTEITDKGLEMLTAHPTLRRLALNLGRCVTDDGIKHLGKMKHMSHLELTNPTTVTGKCLAIYPHPENLITLNLEHMPLKPEDLSSLSNYKNLLELDLSNCQLSDRSMTEVAKVSSLLNLKLAGSHITGSGLMKLTALKKLGYLKIKHCSDLDEKDVRKFRSLLPKCVVEYSQGSELREKMGSGMEFLQNEVTQMANDKSDSK